MQHVPRACAAGRALTSKGAPTPSKLRRGPVPTGSPTKISRTQDCKERDETEHRSGQLLVLRPSLCPTSRHTHSLDTSAFTLFHSPHAPPACPGTPHPAPPGSCALRCTAPCERQYKSGQKGLKQRRGGQPQRWVGHRNCEETLRSRWEASGTTMQHGRMQTTQPSRRPPHPPQPAASWQYTSSTKQFMSSTVWAPHTCST